MLENRMGIKEIAQCGHKEPLSATQRRDKITHCKNSSASYFPVPQKQDTELADGNNSMLVGCTEVFRHGVSVSLTFLYSQHEHPFNQLHH